MGVSRDLSAAAGGVQVSSLFLPLIREQEKEKFTYSRGTCRPVISLAALTPTMAPAMARSAAEEGDWDDCSLVLPAPCVGAARRVGGAARGLRNGLCRPGGCGRFEGLRKGRRACPARGGVSALLHRVVVRRDHARQEVLREVPAEGLDGELRGRPAGRDHR